MCIFQKVQFVAVPEPYRARDRITKNYHAAENQAHGNAELRRLQARQETRRVVAER
jgi:hypothetical protein